MSTAVWIGIAGFFGAMARYGVAGLVSSPDEQFPWGTFVVNITGSLVLGFLVAVFSHRIAIHPDLRIALTVGFLGAYTTFSTFALETFEFAETSSILLAGMNIAASIICGLAAVWVGTRLGGAI
jgi:fluoride exporter